MTFFTGKVETVDLLDEIIAGFNAQSGGITVEQEYQNDASNIIKIKFASGEAPDIMTTYEQEYVDQGKYLDLSDMDEIWNRLIPSMKESCTDINSGKQYRICTNMTMAGSSTTRKFSRNLALNPQPLGKVLLRIWKRSKPRCPMLTLGLSLAAKRGIWAI